MSNITKTNNYIQLIILPLAPLRFGGLLAAAAITLTVYQ